MKNFTANINRKLLILFTFAVLFFGGTINKIYASSITTGGSFLFDEVSQSTSFSPDTTLSLYAGLIGNTSTVIGNAGDTIGNNQIWSYLRGFANPTCSTPNCYINLEWQYQNVNATSSMWLNFPNVNGISYTFQFYRSGGGIWTLEPAPTTSKINSYYPTDNLATTSPGAFTINYTIGTDGGTTTGILYTVFQNEDTGENILWQPDTAKWNGTYTATSSIGLPNGKYTWRKLILNPSTEQQKGELNISTFIINESIFTAGYATSTPYNELYGSTFGTTTVSETTSLLGFLNVPEILKNKLPFAYIFEIQEIITSSLASSTTIPLTAGIISIKLLPTLATTTIDMFSADTIKVFFTPDLIAIFRGLEVYFLWFTLMWFLYHDAKNKHLF